MGLCVCMLELILLLGTYILRGGKRLAFYVCIFFVLSMPILLVFGYFFSDKAWLDASACLAIWQTNIGEAFCYIEERINGLCLVYVFAYGIAVVYIIKCVFDLEFVNSVNMSKIAIVLFCFICLFGLYRTKYNIMTNIVYNSYVYINNYRDYTRSSDLRKERVKELFGQITKGTGGIFVLVIGESQNRDHMGAYGYKENNTPWLTSIKNTKSVCFWDRVYSSEVSTVPALTYALTSKNQYNDISLDEAYSIVDIANAAGYKTAWISNQVQYGNADVPISAIANEADYQDWHHIPKGDFFDGDYFDVGAPLDIDMVECLKKLSIEDDMLIIIHLMGSHNKYKNRYSNDFAIYDSGDKSIDEYDNSILYNDYVIEKIFGYVVQLPTFNALIYFADHGEGVDEHLWHNPNNFTWGMARVPMWMYFSDRYIETNREIFDNLKENSNSVFTNDLIFNAVIGIMNIKYSDVYESENDITSKEYDSRKSRFRTLYGRKSILD